MNTDTAGTNRSLRERRARFSQHFLICVHPCSSVVSPSFLKFKRSRHLHRGGLASIWGGGGLAACCFRRSVTTSATQPVQVGSMSITGMISATKVGRNRSEERRVGKEC